MKVGFIGLGRMGYPMASNLVKAGYEVVAHNRSPGPLTQLVALGAQAVSTPQAVACEVDVLLTCLMSPEQIEQVYLGPDGALSGARRGQIFVDCSTTHPELSRRLAAELTQAGVSFLDAPVSGGPKGAEQGTLAIMVGGDASALDEVRPMLAVLGQHIFHMGSHGAGNSAKLCNQILTGTAHILVAEAMVLGKKLGLDPQTLFSALQVSSGQCRALDRAVPEAILPRDFSAAFTIEGMIKDLDCALQAAAANGVELTLPAVAREIYQATQASGHGAKHLAAVILPMEKRAGVEVGLAPT